MKQAIVIRIEEGDKKKLESLAGESRRTLSDYVRKVLEDAIKNKIKV